LTDKEQYMVFLLRTILHIIPVKLPSN